MKTSMALTMILLACSLCLGANARAATGSGDVGETKQPQGKGPTAAEATAAQDANLVKDEKKDTTATEAQAIVQLACVTGDCYKDAVTDPCYSIGENGCIRPNGNQASENGSSPANANK
jgi:hypothetical protein